MLTLSQFAKRRQSEPVLNFQNIGLSRSTDFTAEKEKPTVVLSSTQRLGDPKGLPPRPTRINRAILPPLRPTQIVAAVSLSKCIVNKFSEFLNEMKDMKPMQIFNFAIQTHRHT